MNFRISFIWNNVMTDMTFLLYMFCVKFANVKNIYINKVI